MEEEDSDNSEYHSDTLLSDQEEQAREIPPDTVADPDMPADHLTPTQVETTARMEVDSALDELLIYMNEDDPDYRSGLDTLTPLSDKLASLQEKVLPRISKIAEDAARNQQRQEWVAYKTKVKRDIAKYFKILEKKDVQNEKRLLEENISGLGSRMTGAIETVAAQLTGLEGKQGYQIPRDLYLQFKAVLDPVRKQLEEEIPRLYTELCSKDPGAAFTVEEQRTTLENQIRGILLAVQTRLDNLPREEVSFSQPQSSSTPNSSINPGSGNDSLTSSVRSGARTSYKKIVEQIPRFNGDPIRYPQWKTEMKEDILPGNSEPHCIRVLADHCPITDLGDVPDRTLEEAWKILDNFYANPNVVSSHVIPAFLDMTVLPGNSKQEQLVHLYKRLEKMHGTLAAVGKADSLVNSESALTKARKLMPNKYLEEFAYEENRALQEKNVDFLPDKEVFKLLMAYLKTKHRMFIGVDLVSPTCGVGPLPNATQFAPKPVQQTRTGDSGGSRSNGGKAGKGGKGGPSTHHLSGGGGGGGGGNSGRSGAGGSGLGTGGGSNPFTPPKPTDQEMRAIRAEWKKLGPCPHCKEEGHMFYYKREKTWRPSHQLSNCPQWMQLGKDDRANYIVTNKFCYKCTSRNHHQLQCDKIHATWKCRAKNSAGVQCSEFHSHHLHGTSVVLHLLQSYNIGRENWVPGPGDVLDDEEFMLLMRQDVMLPVVGHTFSGPNGDVPATILLDSGSNTTVVTNKLARQLGLKGRTVTQEVQVVGRDPEPMQITFYPFTFDTFKGPKRMILLGMDKISSTPGNFSVDAAYDCFPWCEPGSLEKPAGDIDMILGTDNCSLLPTGGEGQSLVGNLRVMNIPFSSGRVLLGSDSRISFTNPVVNREVFHIMKAPRSSFNSFHPVCNSFRGSVQEQEMEALQLQQEMEMMPFSLPARCHTCRSCQFCSFQEPGMTVKEKRELHKLEAGITWDKERKKILCKYPLKDGVDLSLFKDNREQAIKRCQSMINSLKKSGELPIYQKQVEDYVVRKVWIRTTLEEIEARKAQGKAIHYVAHMGVRNPSSKTTPLRLVVDSSVRNNYSGPRLTEIFCKGPNYINNLNNVLTQWRSFWHCGVFDYSKAYHSLETPGEDERMMRLVVWKMNGEGEWVTFFHAVVGMGDTPAAVLLELAKKVAAREGNLIDPILCLQLLPMSYVDDGLLGGSSEDIDRMRGQVLEGPDGGLVFTGTLAQVSALVGLRAKNFCRSMETDKRCLERQGKVLGLTWHADQDQLSFKLSANLTPRKGAGRLGPDMTLEDIPKLATTVFTRRIALQVAAFNWDPLGLIGAFLMKFKIALKHLVALDYGWDQPLDNDLQEVWRGLVKELLETTELRFPRSVYIPDSVGRPELVVYADGSTVAFGSIVYIRWQLSPGVFEARLVTSKGRVTPSKNMTPPRSELQGLILAVRLTTNIMRYHSTRPRRVTLVTDSECSVASCDVNAGSLATFFANRVLEIQETMTSWGTQIGDVGAKDELDHLTLEELGEAGTLVDLVQHTPGLENPADMPTRDKVSWSDLGPDSTWQKGPAYLMGPRMHWPVSREFVSAIPDSERKMKFVEQQQLKGLTENSFTLCSFWSLAITSSKGAELAGHFLEKVRECMAYSDSYTKVRMIVARGALIMRGTRDKARAETITAAIQRESEWLMQLASQDDLVRDVSNKSKYESLDLFTREGVTRTRGRLSQEDMIRSTGHDSLVVLANVSRLSRLIMIRSHEEDHRSGPGDCLFRSRRSGFWIIRGRSLARDVVNKCLWCRLHKTLPLKQKMAELPRQIFNVPTRAFTNICLDFAAPITVTALNKRTTAKAYPALFVCINTGAVDIIPATGYSTEDFLTVWETFCARHGTPVFAHTDMGTQLTAAAKRLNADEDCAPVFPMKEIAKLTNPYGTEWRHCPTQSQWRNGRAESTVRSYKSSMKHMHKGGRLTYAELCCLLSKISSCINDRPLGVRHHGGAEGGFCVVTPNLLLQGGRVCAGPEHSGDFRTDMGRLSARLKAVEHQFRCWWEAWYDQVWDSLVPFKKWKTQQRNARVGDIVLVKYDGALKDPVFRRGMITAAHPDKNGLVRDVTVATQPKVKKDRPVSAKARRPVEYRLPVQRIIVLLPAEEVSSLEPASESLHICEDDLRVPDLLTKVGPSPDVLPHDADLAGHHVAAFPEPTGMDESSPSEPGDEDICNPPPRDSGASPLSPSLGPTCHTPPQGSKNVRHTPISAALHSMRIPDDSAPVLDFRMPEVDPRDLPITICSLAVNMRQEQHPELSWKCWQCETRGDLLSGRI